jgi:hypothetical protein
MRTLDRFQVQVALTFVLDDCGVLRVGQRTGAAGAQTGDVVLIATEGLGHSSTRHKPVEHRADPLGEAAHASKQRALLLDLVRAKALVDRLPDHFVVLHRSCA